LELINDTRQASHNSSHNLSSAQQKLLRTHRKKINRISFTMSTFAPKKLHDALQSALSPTSRRPILNPRYMISRRGSASPSRPAPASRGTRRSKSSPQSMQEMMSAYNALVKEMDDDEDFKRSKRAGTDPVRRGQRKSYN
jgi:hypothetical protein